jgi:hypothetical protein
MELTQRERQRVFMDVLEEMTEKALEKALLDKDKPAKKEPISFFTNPYDFQAQTGMWKERRSAVSHQTLRTIAERNPIISAIINTRIQQVATFSSPARLLEASGNNTLGYKIIHRDRAKDLTEGEKNYVLELENYIWHCGMTGQNNIYSRDNFDIWLRKIVRDSLTFDGSATELVPTRKGAVAEFHAIDTATIRLALTRQEMDEEEERAFVQIMNGQVVTEYRPDEIMYGIRNPTTAIQNNGYGVSEIEQLIAIVTNIFNAMTHNAQFFKNGAAVKGLVNIKPSSKSGGVPVDQFEAFKRAWKAMVTGTMNAWTTPILQSEGVEFINMGHTNREMEFTRYLDFLVKIAAAVFQIDPAEINFYQSANSGGSAPMFEGNQEAKLKMSRDKGLRPLLSAVSRWINQFIIERLTDDFYFCFVGIDSKDEKEIVEIRKEEVGSYKTLDEVRQEAGLEALGEEKGGDLVLNPQYVQYRNQQAMMANMGGEGGEKEEAGDEEGEEEKVKEQGASDGEEETEKSWAGRAPKCIKIFLDD